VALLLARGYSGCEIEFGRVQRAGLAPVPLPSKGSTVEVRSRQSSQANMAGRDHRLARIRLNRKGELDPGLEIRLEVISR
jgi:hypothetical protein